MNAAQSVAQGGGGGIPNLSGAGAPADDDDDDDIPDLEAPEEEGPVDETGVEAKDIELVMQQVNCSRAKAVRVLKESGGDLINASAFFHESFSTVTVSNGSVSPSHGGERVIVLFFRCCVNIIPVFCTCFPIIRGDTMDEISDLIIAQLTRLVKFASIIWTIAATLQNNSISPIHLERSPRPLSLAQHPESHRPSRSPTPCLV